MIPAVKIGPEAARETSRIEVESVAAAEDPVEDESEGGATGELVLRGTLVVLDERGHSHPHEDGTLELVLWDGGYHWSHEVEVVGGSWSDEVPARATLSVEELVVGGRRARLDAGLGERLPVPESGVLDLLARWIPRSELVVRAADTGAELGDLEVVRMRRWRSTYHDHPGVDPRQVLTGASSPIDLDVPRLRDEGAATIFVRAPGYAWKRYQLDPDRSGERLVQLVRGGSLSVEVLGLDPDTDVHLSLIRQNEKTETTEFRLEDGTVLLDGVEPDVYLVGAALGGRSPEPFELGSIEVEVRAGQRVEAVLELDPAAEPEVADLAGTVFVPAAWEVVPATLGINRTAVGRWVSRSGHAAVSLEAVAGVPGTYSWSVAELELGTYELTLDDPPWEVEIELPPGGRRDVEVVVPPPVRVVVDVVDGRTGAPVPDVRSLLWFGPRAVSKEVSRTSPPSRFEFSVPPGRSVVRPMGNGFAGKTYFEVERAETFVTLEVLPNCKFTIVLEDAGAIVPWENGWPLSVTEQPDDCWSTAHSGDGSAVRLEVGAPGRYVVQIGPLVGFEPVPLLEVEAVAGEEPEHVVQLTRSP